MLSDFETESFTIGGQVECKYSSVMGNVGFFDEFDFVLWSSVSMFRYVVDGSQNAQQGHNGHCVMKDVDMGHSGTLFQRGFHLRHQIDFIISV